ncbi:MAG TPA: hypothetical protein PK370_02340 [Candidatus Woesebacteria bacterium]|nr:hypothetical protein [Candidatus Woesebacteria bacterium]HPJ16601.1 hypothetical protein [Candidatus Woesebacteria bacterium]
MKPSDIINNVDPIRNKYGDLGTIISGGLQYVYVIAGIILLMVIVFGGIQIMTAAGDQKKVAGGYAMITNGVIGFVLIFVAYFVAQLVQIIFGIKFL